MPPKSAIPDIYYFCFGAYEPFLNIVGFLGTLAYVCLLNQLKTTFIFLLAILPACDSFKLPSSFETYQLTTDIL
jgi:hypothetical protein